MNSLFNEITESQASSVVGGLSYLDPVPNNFIFNTAIASATANASTGEPANVGFPETFAFANTTQNDAVSTASAGSQSRVFYDFSNLPK